MGPSNCLIQELQSELQQKTDQSEYLLYKQCWALAQDLHHSLRDGYFNYSIKPLFPFYNTVKILKQMIVKKIQNNFFLSA